MPARPLPRPSPRFLTGAALPFIACGVQWLWWDWLKPHSFLLFYPTVFISALIAGFWGGMAATALAVAMVWYVFFPPEFSFALYSPALQSASAVFAASGLFFSLFSWKLHRQTAALKRSRDHLEDLVAARTRELAEGNARISELYNRAPCGYHSLDATGLIVEMNDTELAMLGYPRDEVVGRMRIRDLLTPESRAVFDQQFPAFLATGRVKDLDLDFRCRDGAIRSLRINAIGRTDAGGKVLNSLSTALDITERRQAEIALLAAQRGLEQGIVERTAQLRRLAMETTLAEERERQSIARDLHDGIGQLLHIARIRVDSLAGKDADSTAPILDSLRILIMDASRQVRSLTSQLSPPALAELGLVGALRWLGDEMARTYGLVVELEDDRRPKPLDPAQSAILFRVVRELLINVSKHAQVDRARVELRAGCDRLHLAVSDRGVGMAGPEDAVLLPDRFGLASVRERIIFLGGRMELTSRPDSGTRIEIEMPLADQTASLEKAA